VMKSPYLTEEGRLGDVIAAIQAMAIYKCYKLDFEGWADRLSADKTRADHWKGVFENHPEFFRLDGQRAKASLVWRRQYPKRYSVDTLAEISREQYDGLSDLQKTRISRLPLPASEIKTLIDTAINLHSRALDADKHQSWYKPIFLQALAALCGAIIGTLAVSYLKPASPPQIIEVRVPTQPNSAPSK
jgi:hypothetical protein